MLSQLLILQPAVHYQSSVSSPCTMYHVPLPTPGLAFTNSFGAIRRMHSRSQPVILVSQQVQSSREALLMPTE